MTDGALDPRFERDLRAVLAELEPLDPPARLSTFVVGVPSRAARRRLVPALGGGWRAYAVLAAAAAAAAVAIVVLGIAGGVLRVPGTPDVGAPSVAPHTQTYRLYYEVAPLDRHVPSDAEISRVQDTLLKRLQTFQSGSGSQELVPDRPTIVSVDVEVPADDPGRLDRIRSLLTETGMALVVGVDGVVPPGATSIDAGSETLVGPGQGVTPTVRTDATGTSLDLALDTRYAQAVAAWSDAHPGTTLAVTIDDVVVATAGVDAAASAGRLTFPFPAADVAAGTPQRIAALLTSGPLPVAIREVAPEGLPLAPGITAEPSATASPTVAPGSGLHIEYRVDASSEAPAVARVMTARLRSAAIAEFSVVPGADGSISVDVSVPADDASVAGPVRRLLEATGHLDIVPLGQDALEVGSPVDPAAHPALLAGDEVAGAELAFDQTGLPALQLTFTADGRATFAAWTAAHVGDYLAFVLDGTAISVPVLRDSIPDGVVQVSGDGGWGEAEVSRLVALLSAGELPAPVREVATNAR